MFSTQRTVLGLDPTKILLGIGVCIVALIGVSHGWFWYVWIGFLAVMLILNFYRDGQRTKLMRQFAADKGMSFVGDSLPPHFPRQQTSSRQAHSISRVVVGNEVLLFDCRIGHGKASRARTIIAARREPSVFGWARFGPDLETEQTGDWTLVYSANRVLDLQEIRALISELSHSMSHMGPNLNVAGSQAIRPETE